MSVPLFVGLCLPETCNPKGKLLLELENSSLSSPIPNPGHGIDYLLNTTSLTCQPLSTEWTTEATLVMCVIGVFVFLAVVGSSMTVYEHYTMARLRRDPTCLSIHAENTPILGDVSRGNYGSVSGNDRHWIPPPRWLLKLKSFLNCFCIFTNGKKILNTNNMEGQLQCLHGIRVLSMTWIIMGHLFGMAFLGLRNLPEAGEMMDAWPFQIIYNAFLAVDSFFLLSGLLLSLLFFEEYSKTKGKISWLYFYIHRFVRLTPAYMIVLAIYTHLTPYLSTGPVRIFFQADQACLDSWWWNLLYINNFKGQNDQCIAWSWYLANDMQFYIISPLFLISMYRWPTFGLSLICLFFCISSGSSFVLTYAYDLISGMSDLDLKSGFPVMLDKRWDEFFRRIYIKPYARLGPYLVGIVLGYCLFRRKRMDPKRFRLITLSAGWMIASTVTLACLFGPYHQHPSLLTRSLYNAFHRTCFAGSLAWVIFLCLTGQGDFVNSIFSWKAWIPFSRLTFCAYLVHPMIQMLYFTSLKRLMEYSLVTMAILYLGFLIVSYAVALVISLLFESPILRAEKLIRNKFSSSKVQLST